MPSSEVESFSDSWEISEEVNERDPIAASSGLLTQQVSSIKDDSDYSHTTLDERDVEYIPPIYFPRNESGWDREHGYASEDPESPTQIYAESNDNRSYQEEGHEKNNNAVHDINFITTDMLMSHSQNRDLILQGTSSVILKGFTDNDDVGEGDDGVPNNTIPNHHSERNVKSIEHNEFNITQATNFSIMSGDTLQVPSQFIPMILTRNANMAAKTVEGQESKDQLISHNSTIATEKSKSDHLSLEYDCPRMNDDVPHQSSTPNSMKSSNENLISLTYDNSGREKSAAIDSVMQDGFERAPLLQATFDDNCIGRNDVDTNNDEHNREDVSLLLEGSFEQCEPHKENRLFPEIKQCSGELKKLMNVDDSNYFFNETQLFVPDEAHDTVSEDKTLTTSQLFSYPSLDPLMTKTRASLNNSEDTAELMIGSLSQSKVSRLSSFPNANINDENDDLITVDRWESFGDSLNEMNKMTYNSINSGQSLVDAYQKPPHEIRGIGIAYENPPSDSAINNTDEEDKHKKPFGMIHGYEAVKRSLTNPRNWSSPDDIEESETNSEREFEERKSKETRVGSVSPHLTKYGRTTRVVSAVSAPTGIARNSVATFHADELESDSDNSGETGKKAFALSQRTETIQRQLGELSEVNVDSIVKNLMRAPTYDNTSLQQKNERLHVENSTLSRKNKELSRLIKSLEHEVTRLNSSLEREKQVSAAMKSELDRLQPLIKVAIDISNRVQQNIPNVFDAGDDQSPPIDVSDSSKGLTRKKVVIKDSDEDSDSSVEENSSLRSKKSDTPRKTLAFPSPKPPLAMTSKIAKASIGPKRKDQKRLKTSTTDYRKPRPNFNEVWKFLKSKGWSHKIGPEPYAEKVYVPPKGNVKIGAKIGIDFFHGHDLYEKAEKLGFQTADYLSDSSDRVPISALKDKGKNKRLNVESSTKDFETKNGDAVHISIGSDSDDADTNVTLDNTILCGPSKALTLFSAKVCGRILISAAKCGDDLKFMRDLFKPLWHCLKDEQSEGWKYERSIGPLSRSYFFVPPRGSGKGALGRDFFTSEESVVLFILNEIREIDKNFLGGPSIEKNFEYLSNFLEEKAIEEDTNAIHAVQTDQRRQRRGTHLASSKANEKCDHNASYVDREDRKRKAVESHRDFDDLNGSNHIATQDGVHILLEMRAKKKSESGIILENCKDHSSPLHAHEPSLIKRKVASFHLSQTPEVQLPLQITSRKDASIYRDNKPFDGLSFFVSGLDDVSCNQIRSLGGSIISDLSGEVLNASNVTRKLFFVSEPTKRRTHKYLLAGSLGAPMLHRCWVNAIFHRFQSKQQTNVFDSVLYSSYRLPLGLSTSSGLFILQKARNAKKWCRPGCQDNGDPLFQGLNIIIALDNQDSEKKWFVCFF